MARRNSSKLFVACLGIAGCALLLLLWIFRGPENASAEQILEMSALMETALPAYTEAVNDDVGHAREKLKALDAQTEGFDEHTRKTLRVLFERELEASNQSDGDAAADRLTTQVAAVNHLFAERGYPFYLESEVNQSQSHRLVVVFTFKILDTLIFDTPVGAIRALYLRRLDKLNWDYRMLAYAAEDRKEVSVLLDRVDGIVTRQIRPALAGTRKAPIWDEDEEPLDPKLAELAKRIHAAVQREIPAAAGNDKKLTEQFALSLARHEVQHILDSHEPGANRDRARAELSAYLAELARDSELQTLSLALLVGYAIHDDGDAESSAAKIIFRELGKGLGIQADTPEMLYAGVIEARTADRQRVARETWERLFARSFATVTRR